MAKEDKILDILDNVNSIKFGIENSVGSVEVKSSYLIDSLNEVKKGVVSDLNNFKENELFKLVETKRLNDLIKGKFSSRLSLLYKIDELKGVIRREGETVKISESILNYFKNNV